MSETGWRVVVDTNQARRFWEELEPGVRAQVEQELRAHPFYDPQRPKARKHIKGKIANRVRRCYREYRSLVNNCRIFYCVDEHRREIRLLHAGAHP